MKRIILNTEWYHKGWDEKNGKYVSGSIFELLDNPNIPNKSIAWDDNAFDTDESRFMELINKAVTDSGVEKIGIVGRAGIRNGYPIGGKIIESHLSPLDYFIGDINLRFYRCPTTTVELDGDGVVTICGYYHLSGAAYRMNLFLLSEEDLLEFAPAYWNYGGQTFEDMEAIYEHLNPLKFK